MSAQARFLLPADLSADASATAEGAVVTATLAYLAPMTERPFNYMYEPSPGAPPQNAVYQGCAVEIADVRAMARPPSIEVAGFELWDAPTSVKDFRDDDEVRSRYYAEATELARRVSGAAEAHVFDHAVRQREAGRPALTFGRRGDGSRPAAVGRVHVDYSEASGPRRADKAAAAAGIVTRGRRFAIVNIWRSIRGRIVDTPLALCDARTIAAQDLVPADIQYRDRTGELYLVQHAPRHRWAYVSDMDRHEALVFKQYDSQVNGVARFTPHAAFDLPDIPADAPLRESIEVRCLVIYD